MFSRFFNADLGSPGSYENLHREAKMVFPTAFLVEGVKFDLSSILSQQLQASHSFAWFVGITKGAQKTRAPTTLAQATPRQLSCCMA